MRKTIKIILPKGFMNVGVSTANVLIADTNDSKNWDNLRVPLPKGDWEIKNKEGKHLTLIEKKRTFWTPWF